MMLQLRPYQEEAVAAVEDRWQYQKDALLSLPTGSGKTIIFTSIVKRFTQANPTARVAVLAHQTELISQAAQKMEAILPGKVGIACASLDANADLERPVTIGTIQTLARREIPPFDLIIIDEAHHLPPPKEDGQYNDFLGRQNGCKLLGVTATPWRLTSGFIYGDGRHFEEPAFELSIGRLQSEGFLCPIRAKVPQDSDLSGDLSAVPVRMGEFAPGALEDVMSKPVHVQSAVKAYEKWGEGRSRCLVFCVGIAHAELVQKAFKDAGYAAGIAHSKRPWIVNAQSLQNFRDGGLDVMVNVAQLTEGIDVPETDLIIMLRPTMSAGLYLQMLGRGTRIAEGKTDVLLLDLVGNVRTHGHWDHPRITADDETRAPLKACPACEEAIPKSSKVCPACGYIYEPRTRETLTPEINDLPGLSDYLGDNQIFPVSVLSHDFSLHISKAGNRCARLSLRTRNQDGEVVQVNHFMLFEGKAGFYGRRTWRQLARSPRRAPKTTNEALRRAHELKIPQNIQLTYEGRWPKVEAWN